MGNFSCISAFLIVCLLIQVRLEAQHQSSDLAISKASADHLKLLGEHAAIYAGTEYVGYGQQINGTPFWGEDKIFGGHLVYQGVLYKDLPLFYDLVNDAVILRSFDKKYFIRLASDKISEFTLGGSLFVKNPFQAVSEADRLFLQVLYQGKVTVYARREKVIVAASAGEKANSYFQQFNRYFIATADKWHTIKRQRDIISIFPDQKEALKRWISNQPYSFKKEPETMLVQSISYIESLKH